MLEIIQAGGVVLYIIIFCSVIALGFIIERLLVFHVSKCNMAEFYPQLEKYIKLGKIKDAAIHCKNTSGLLPNLFLVGLKHKDETIENIHRVLVDEVQIHTLPTMEKNLSVLATIGKGTPMLGLLGTVIGMINTFEVIADVGLGDPQKMADGIRLALTTTAGGMMVAIPIIFIHAYFRSRIREFELEIYHYLTRFLRILRKRKEIEE